MTVRRMREKRREKMMNRGRWNRGEEGERGKKETQKINTNRGKILGFVTFVKYKTTIKLYTSTPIN